MEQQHKIEESVFDFHFDSEDVAFDQHLAIETLVKQRLLPVIDEVFTDMSASATVHRIETLEIDLGLVRAHEVQDELPRRLRERLRSLLQERLLGEPLEDAAPVQPLDPTALAWEQLQAFLRYGYLPWQATPGHDQSIEQLFHHVLQADPSRLLAFLQHAPQRATVLQRLVRQLPPVSLADLVRTLAPSQAHFVRGLLETVPQLWGGQAETRTRPTAFQALLWEQVLAVLLSTPGDALAPYELAHRILSSVLRHQGRAEVQTLSRLTQTVTQRLLEAEAVMEEGPPPLQHAETEPRPPEASFQPSAFPGEGAGLEATTGAGISDALAASRAALPMALPERLVDALVRGDMALLQESWPALLRQYPVLLRQLLHHHARQAARRRSLVRRLPEAMLRDVFGLLAPEGQRAIMALLAQPEALQQVIRTATRHDLRRRLWEYTLAYLLVQPRTGFQATTYLDSLVQQLALQAQVGYHDVLRALAHGLQQHTTTARPEPALEQALHTLLRERYDRTPLGRETPDSASRALLQAYELYDRLVRRVRAGSSDVSDSVESLIPVIDRLAQAHPSLLLRLYRAMQSGELAVTTLINALTAPELERLLQALLPLLHLPGGDEPALSLSTVAQQAAQASDTRAYYGTVLRTLAEELPLAVATARAREPAETASPAWRFQAVGHALAVAAAAAQLETAAMPLTDERYERLRQHLRQEPESSRLPDSDLTPVIAVLAQEQPALLLQLYWECQTGALPLAALVRALTPPELAGLLRAWLGLPALGGTSATAEVLQRITVAAAQATAARDYYGAVLRALMEERPLDVRTLLDPTPALQSETPRGLSGAAEAERPAEESPGEGRVPGPVSEADVSPEAIEAQEAPDETVSWRVYEATEAVRETVGRPAQALSPGTSGPPSAAMLRAYEHYARLWQRLRAQPAVPPTGTENLLSCIDALARTHPALLLRLYQALQTGEVAIDTVVTALTVPELGRLIQALVRLLQTAEGGDATSVLEAMAQAAAQGADGRRYYGVVLRALVDRPRQEIGLVLGEQPSPPASASSAARFSEEAYQRLRQRLREGSTAPAPESPDLVPLIEALFQEQPMLLWQLYQECQTGALALGAVVQALSPAELAGLLRAWLRLTVLGGDELQRGGVSSTLALADILRATTVEATQEPAARRYYGALLHALVAERWQEITVLLAAPPVRQEGAARARGGLATPPSQTGTEDAPVTSDTVSTDVSPLLRPHEDITPPAVTIRPERASLDAVTEDASVALLRAYERYARVWQRLVQDREAPEAPVSDLVPLIEALAQEQPGLLLRLYLELQTGAVALTTLTSRLSVAECAALLRALVHLVRGADPSTTADVLSTLDRATTEGQALQQSYLQVLQALLYDQVDEVAALSADQQAAVSRQASGRQEPLADGGDADTTSAPVDTAPVLADGDEARLLHYLRAEATVPSAELPRVRQTFEWLLARQPARLRWVLEPLLENPQTATRLITLLPERLLTRLLFLLRPAEHYALQAFADALALACYGRGVPLTPARIQQVKWQFLFQYVFQEGLPFQEETFVQRLADALAHAAQAPDTLAFRDLLSQQLARAALPQPQYQALLAALRPAGAAIQETTAVAVAESLPADTAEPTENIYITNAGQVLAAPYLPRLLAILGLVEGPAFHDQQAAERAVHLLQFMVNESTTSPEYQLVLNKLLCGVRTGVPIVRGIVITEQEKDTIESLIRGMIQHWKIIGNTSVAGLREAFLQREGRLQLRDNAWHLLVEPRAFDMLLDQLPWSIATIKLPWMEHVLYVEWR